MEFCQKGVYHKNQKSNFGINILRKNRDIICKKVVKNIDVYFLNKTSKQNKNIFTQRVKMGVYHTIISG